MVRPVDHKGADKQTGSSGTASASVDAGRDPFGLAQWMPGASLHPLMANPTAAVVAATAVGLGMTSQMAGFMLGAMQGFVDATQKSAPQSETPLVPVDAVTPESLAPVESPVVEAKAPKRPRAARIVKTRADDLKRISGIGPKLEQVLNGMGIRQYADIARWTAKDAQRVDEQLGFSGRVGRDEWVAQARALMKA
ncbi:hypothetical protein [Pararhizobium antarcticum]|uniref:NADH:ubiquinone oxidoreductase n=1 Tax=Pararhizobium antarcticum TaxID=1798805 RepID=A0A657LWR3_9HYPH|nr:hypothetical protein [Pararhizobium antarcticum]OJG00220.1 hypothetical protein AX760_10875 [Pararhizobium antarcticum]OJG00852.1 hypothetical protein AX761_07985 [Rhizobium sp. 58]